MSSAPIQSIEIGNGQPIVLLHAFPLSHLVWKDIQPPPGYRFVLPDFPGFGSSPIAPEGFTLQEAAKGLQKYLEESGIKEPFLLGGLSIRITYFNLPQHRHDLLWLVPLDWHDQLFLQVDSLLFHLVQKSPVRPHSSAHVPEIKSNQTIAPEQEVSQGQQQLS